MKNIIYSFAMIATTSLMLFSCSSKPKTITLTPKSIELRGDLKEYFEVVDKEYTLTDELFGKMIKVELKKVKEMPFEKSKTCAYGTSGYDVERYIGFGIKVFDKEDNIIEQTAATGDGMQGPYSSEDVMNFKTIEVGETSIIRWTLDTKDEKILRTLCSFEITTATEDTSGNSSINWGNQKSTSSSSSASKSSSSSKGSSKWDSVLNDYEKYVNDYIKVMKKANAGDISALTDAMGMMESASSLAEKLEDAEGELSATQASRYLKITEKMINAAL